MSVISTITTFLFVITLVCVLVQVLAPFLPFLVPARNKLQYNIRSLVYLITTKDLKKRGPKAPVLLPADPPVRVLTYVFVRHGQSRWNSYVNTFDLWWPFRVVTMIITETVYFFTAEHESNLADSPLTTKGLDQARSIAGVVASVGLHKTKPYKLITSNLRRAIETAILCCSEIGTTNNAKRISVFSDLQEISRNIDALSLCVEPGAPPRDLDLASMGNALFTKATDFEHNRGNKKASDVGDDRIDSFVQWSFGAEQKDEVLYIVGHSGWMKSFFRRYVPAESHHNVPWVKTKLKNCAVVSFDVGQFKNGAIAVIPSTIKLWN